MTTIHTKPPFAVYEDYEGKLHIIDANTRTMLSDSFAYDLGANKSDRTENRMARMEKVAEALNAGWNQDKSFERLEFLIDHQAIIGSFEDVEGVTHYRVESAGRILNKEWHASSSAAIDAAILESAE